MMLSILILSVILLIFNFLLLFALRKGKFKNTVDTKDKFTTFSILIAAKNEEKNLGATFESLKKLDYPSEHFEIIFIDDNSTDTTFQIAEKFSIQISNLKILSAKGKKIEGKKGALQLGFETAKNEIIVTTDADCTVPTDWLNELNKKFLAGNDLVIGAVRYKKTKKIISQYSAFESLRNRMLIFAFANLGLPYSASGGNFAFRKSVLKSLGGYSQFSQVLSGDDDLLVQKARKQKMKITTILSENSIVQTEAPTSFHELFKQRSRHVSTSNYYSLEIKVFLSLWHLVNIFAFVSIFLFWLNTTLLIFAAVKFTLDLISVKISQKKFRYNFGILKILLLQFLYEIFVPVYYLKGTFGKIEWR